MLHLDHWLSVRIRLICGLIFIVSLFLPPYVPKPALADSSIQTGSNFLLVEDGFIHKTSSVALQGGRIAYSKGIFHTVKSGEGLEKIANRYGISIDTIRWANNLSADSTIQPGDDLRILPVNGVFHMVQPGETLIKIAQKYDIPLDQIASQNDINNGFILSGQGIIIPNAVPLPPEPEPVPDPVSVAVSLPKPAVVAPNVRNNFGRVIPDTKDAPGYTSTPTYGTLQKPCSDACFITQYYSGGHYALDMQERGGGPIYAAEDGIVVASKTGWNGGYGNYIEIDNGRGRTTLYAHNKNLLVRNGDAVVRGQKIADMGNTGLVYGRTGIHVHFEVRESGIKKNPLLYIQ